VQNNLKYKEVDTGSGAQQTGFIIMIIEKITSLALRCSDCGKLETHQLNIFQLSGEKKLDLGCECGHNKVEVQRVSQEIIIKPYCLACGRYHQLVLPEEQLWNSGDVQALVCPRTRLNLGYYGPFAQLQQEIDQQQRELELLTDGLGFDDFADPKVMLTALDILHDFAAQGELNCECGSHEVNIELLSEQIVLTCKLCAGVLSIPASSPNDINRLENFDSLLLQYRSNTSPTNPRT